MTTSGRTAGEPATGVGPTVGRVLAGRYRLVGLVATTTTTQLWQAADDVLARPVAVKVLLSRDPARVAAFLRAAAETGSVRSPRLAQVYDAAQEPSDEGPGPAYVVSEWLVGVDLTGLLQDGPLPPDQVVALARQAADALTAAHAAGVVHGRVHPGNLFVEPGGRLRLTDAGVSAAAYGASAGDTVGGDTVGGDTVAGDTRDLAATVYALLTARWPGGPSPQPAGRLRLAPRVGGRVCFPRQLRAAVPRGIDRAVIVGLDPRRAEDNPGARTPEAFATALERGAAERPGSRPRPERDGRRWPERARRRAGLLVAGAALAGLGAGGYLLGLAVGEVPGEGHDLDAIVGTGAAPAGRPIGLRDVRDVDPGGDGQEQRSAVSAVLDGDPASRWLTDTYRTARFGGLKDGVGLLVDLGSVRDVGRVDVTLTRPGASLELRAGGDPDPHALPVVAAAQDAPTTVHLSPRTPTSARYWVVWLTALPRDPASGGFRAGVGELRFFAR